MWSISEVKETGKAAFKKNYWRCVLVSFILALLTAGSSATGQSSSFKNADQANIPNEQMATFIAFVAGFIIAFSIIWILLRIFVLNHLEVGCYTFLKKNITEDKVDLSELKAGFVKYSRTLVTILLRDIFLALWICLFIIPGLIKSYSYMMVPYILLDEPELSPKEVITRSRKMMNGNKWRAFLLDLSFIGWVLLSLLTCGLVGLLYEEPYRRSARASLYHELKKNS